MRKPTVLMGLLSLLCAVVAAVSWRQLRIERARTAALERSLAALPTRSDTAPPVITGASQPVAADKPPAKTLAEASLVPETNRSPQGQDVRQLMQAAAQREKEMLRDQTYRTSVMDQYRRRFARIRAEAMRVVGMTEEQADRFLDLWVERIMRFSDLGVVAGELPSEPAQAELKRASEAEQTELRTLLGNKKYELLTRYLASGQERAEMNEFRMQLPASAQRLSDGQVDTLVDTIYSERQRSAGEYEEYVRAAGITNRYVVSADDRQRYLDLEYAANQRVHDAVSATLTREQLAALDELLKARLAPSEAALRMQLDGKPAKSN